MKNVILSIPGLILLALALPASAALLPAGALSTDGAQIVDRGGHPVRLACVGWNQVNEGISLDRQTALMVRDGFNCIRFSWVDATVQADLRMMDRVAAAAA
jgi:hypothetical protein